MEGTTLVQITPRVSKWFKETRLRALKDSPGAFGSTYALEAKQSDDEWAARAAQNTGEWAAGFLAMDDNDPCGIVGGRLVEDGAQAILMGMWVAPEVRRKGIGCRLVSAILDWARSRGAQAVRLTVTSNNRPAIAFYQRMGFEMTGETEPYPNDSSLVEYVMCRALG